MANLYAASKIFQYHSDYTIDQWIVSARCRNWLALVGVETDSSFS